VFTAFERNSSTVSPGPSFVRSFSITDARSSVTAIRFCLAQARALQFLNRFVLYCSFSFKANTTPTKFIPSSTGFRLILQAGQRLIVAHHEARLGQNIHKSRQRFPANCL